MATATISVRAVNDPPLALGDPYATDEDVALAVPTPGVLRNDRDPDDGDSLTAGSGPAHGAVTVNRDGSFTDVPRADFHGDDSFTSRTAESAGLLSAEATVAVTVHPVNDPPNAEPCKPTAPHCGAPDHSLRLVTLPGATDPDGVL